MSDETIVKDLEGAARAAEGLAGRLGDIATKAAEQAATTAPDMAVQSSGGGSFLLTALTILVLACFVGYYVVWNVTPALHSPLMGVTNAISSVIIVGALIAAGPSEMGFAKVMGFLAVTLAAVNIFGGFIVTQRMLSMFKRREKPAKKAEG
ncbi:MAG: hypothetical protein Alpg2KO_26530 [Alphaproteobacteria bacterium]